MPEPIDELPRVDATIAPTIGPSALGFSISVDSLVDIHIGEELMSLTMFEVVAYLSKVA